MASAEYSRFTALLNQGAFDDAVRIAEEQTLRRPTDPFWPTQQALALLRAGRTSAAHKAARHAVSVDPSNPWAILARAETALAENTVSDARIDFEHLLDDKRVRGRARRGVLECLRRTGEWNALISRVAEWELPPAHTFAYRLAALQGLGRTDEAARLCRDFLAHNPGNRRALWALTEIEVATEGLEPVLRRIGRLARIPSSPSVYGEIFASLNARAGNSQAAAAQYEKMARAESSPRILRKQAFALAKSGREREALGMMEELLRLDPRDPYLHSAYGAACRRIGELERAWKYYHELIGRHPDEKGLYGRIKRIQKQLEKALPEKSS